MRVLAAVFLVLSFVVLNPAPALAASCQSLASVSMPNTTITLAQTVAAGAFTPPAGGRGGRGAPPSEVLKALPAFCRVVATLRPTSDSEINIEVWLPETGWNGKFQAVGNGGWTGSIAYPALMAADILLYDSTLVPVGDDQKQHVELTRDIAISFNQRYGTECFVIPEPMIPPHGARVKSLRDGTKKMSKSDPSDMSRINLIDDAETIRDKIKRARTDTGVMASHADELKDRPEVANLVEIYAALTGKTTQQVLDHYAGQQFAPFKTDLAEIVADAVTPNGPQTAPGLLV